MPVHAPERGSRRRILPIQALEDPELEESVHDDGHDGNKYVDRLVLRQDAQSSHNICLL